MVNEFYRMCEREAKSKCSEKEEVEVCDLSTLYRASVPVVEKCKVVLGDRMEDMEDFKYLGTVLCKHGDRRRLNNLPELGSYRSYNSAKLNERVLPLSSRSCHDPGPNSQPIIGHELSTVPQRHPTPYASMDS